MFSLIVSGRTLRPSYARYVFEFAHYVHVGGVLADACHRSLTRRP